MVTPKGQAGQPESATWRNPGGKFHIEYALDVMEELRAAVQAGFQKIPYGGLEDGGILYGRFDGDCIRILEWRRIECDHAAGPSFVLSEADSERLRACMEKPEPELMDLIPVGWYASHSRSALLLKPADMELHRARFPEPWHAILLIKAVPDGPVQGTFFLRGEDGGLSPEPLGEVFDIPADPLRRTSERPTAARAKPESEPEPRRRRTPYAPARCAASWPQKPVIPPPVFEGLAPAKPESVEPEKAPLPSFAVDPPPALEPVEAPESEHVENAGAPAGSIAPEPVIVPAPERTETVETPLPSFGGAAQIQPSRLLRRILLAAAALCALGAGAVVALPRLIPDEKATLSLQVVEVYGGSDDQLYVKWSLRAPSDETAERASLELVDGMTTKLIELDEDEIQRGSLTYVRQSGDVQVRMTVWCRKGGQLQELARYIGPDVEPAPQQPPAAPTGEAERERLSADAEKVQKALREEQMKTRRLEQSVATIRARLDQESRRTR
jgi:hypothetical protein